MTLLSAIVLATVLLTSIASALPQVVREKKPSWPPVKDPCTLSPDPGPCEALIPKYFYDSERQTCEQFMWGGCDGVVPFHSLEECEESTCNPCDQSPDPGPCKARFIRHFFNKEIGACDTFVWGGCLGNVPFVTLADCLDAKCSAH
ncbi:unnamed protein product [Chondrus crispus]|uniref:BPTI/Kunitz inhibitor domain-containing protein n=1 Tax=Chondrus crispus TaxID=2769 RepID=R7QHF6_CHOCR|nr:unnamed protein product [Chondrus crispus]CDF36860.1 unnamed protein product [Chondrus crispus]|eukprot:XP_005716679.1 unnamed protein product [Chondrus crispus]